MINVLKAIKTIKKIEQLQKELHIFSLAFLALQDIGLMPETGLSKRMLEQVIESLRVNFRHPIVAKKFKPNGYYLPKNEEERQAGLAPYRRQILTEQKNLSIVMAVDLEKYWKLEHD